MDDLVVPGVVALVIFYAGIVLVAYGIIRLVIMMVQAFLAGNYLFFFGVIACFVVALLVYVAVGLWLRKTGTI
ncbi:MAG: hypothetical protein WCE46_01860 [Methanoregula sp.]|jgi:hypothetical protein|uniref:hypothetical protein n=1 Tax=Methanoregula sp. TaxID=2052170 RepID=UPI003C78B62C